MMTVSPSSSHRVTVSSADRRLVKVDRRIFYNICMPSCLSIFTFTYSLTAPIIHRDGCSGHTNRAHAHVPCQRKKAYALAEQRLLIIGRGLVFKMETMIVQFVCVGEEGVCHHFIFSACPTQKPFLGKIHKR